MSSTQRKHSTANSSVTRRSARKRSRTSAASRRGHGAVQLMDDCVISEGDDVVDLTCEASEAAVVDLTNNDSVVVVDEGPGAREGDECESYVLSSDEESANLGGRADFLSSLEANSAMRATPGTISCPICLDTYGEIVGSRRLVVSTKCGHLFCSQCLRDALAKSHACPTCRKRLNHKQYHPIYI